MRGAILVLLRLDLGPGAVLLLLLQRANPWPLHAASEEAHRDTAPIQSNRSRDKPAHAD